MNEKGLVLHINQRNDTVSSQKPASTLGSETKVGRSADRLGPPPR